MLVSVIMPTYNCGSFIAQSVDSVLAQTLTDWELIIVDDCSTDNTREVLKPYLEKYENIRYTRLSQNSGPQAARTEAMRLASGRYAAFLDSDDLWDKNKLEVQIGYMEKTGEVFTCTGYRQMDENGNSLHTALIPPEKTDYRKMLKLSCPIGNLTVVFNQEKLGKYEVPPIKKRNDFALWLKILHDAECCVGIPDVLGTYRIRTNSVSSNKMKLIKYHWQLYREIEKLSFIKSVWALLSWVWVKGTGKGITKIKTDD